VSVLVNVNPTKDFIPKRGLRHKDSLAPFLFLIVAEGLAGMSRLVVEKYLIDSLEIKNKKVKVNMLQYVNNTLFFCKENTKSVFNIKMTLNCFELSSELKVNFLKSKISELRIDQTTIQRFATILNCDVMVTPFMYLGMLVGGVIREGFFGMVWLKD